MATDIEASAPTAQDRPLPDGSDVRKMTDADVEAVARSLARAFYDDPHMRWVVRDDAIRLDRLERGFTTYITRIWFPHDECYTHDRAIGAALWMPPGTWHLGPWAQLRLLPAIALATRRDLPRLLKVVNFMERHHPHDEHWYLPVIGITPTWQGRGYGAAMLRPVLERCDAEGTPAYLEASTPRNRALYERCGFQLVEECYYAKDGPPLFRMWRDPVPNVPQ
jgi:GNAT superfamily N-acetyltransferase